MSKDGQPPSGGQGFVDDPRESWMKIPAQPDAVAPPPPPMGAPVATPPPPPGYSAAGNPAPYAPAGSDQKNWLGIVSLVLVLLGGGILGFIFGLLGLKAVKNGEANNRGVALAGTIINGALVGIVVLVILIAGLASGLGSERSATLSEGDCFNEPSGTDEDSTEILGLFTIIDCEEPHYGEVYYVGHLDIGVYPGTFELERLIDDECFNRVEARVDLNNMDAEYYAFYYPLEEGFRSGQRNYECYIFADHEISGSVLLD